MSNIGKSLYRIEFGGGAARVLRYMKKKLIILLVLALVGGTIFFFYNKNNSLTVGNDHLLQLSGNVDVREVSLAFRQSDRIEKILVEEGDTVKEGQLLAELESEELKLQIKEMQSQIAAQNSTVAKLHNGTRDEEIRQAEENVKAAEASSEYARGIYNRKKHIYDSSEGISRNEVDNALAEAKAAEAKTTAAKQALREARNGARKEDIAGAEANLQVLKDSLARQEYVLKQYKLYAPANGVVRSRLLEPGDMASPSVPVFKISLMDKKWVRAYIAETDLGKVHEGMQAKIYIDSHPDKPITGQIGYISSTAEFTPKTVQTEELRTALVYEIRVYAEDKENVLRLGMPATVKIDI